MWLRNYYNLLTALYLEDDTLSSSSAPSDYSPPIRVRATNGNYCTPTIRGVSNPGDILSSLIMFGKSNVNLLTSNESVNDNVMRMGIALGTGTTAPNYDDYKLETRITSGITLVAVSGTLKQATQFDVATHKYSSIRNFTINNSSSGNITINEIGLYAQFTDSLYYTRTCMIYREVLSESVTLAPAESIVIAIERNAEIFNYTPYT